MAKHKWIVIPRWDEYNHYHQRVSRPWIKNYTRLLSDEEYRKLTFIQRAVLHGLWLEYARSHCKLPNDTLDLSQRLGGDVKRSTLDVLQRRGFIKYAARP